MDRDSIALCYCKTHWQNENTAFRLMRFASLTAKLMLPAQLDVDNAKSAIWVGISQIVGSYPLDNDPPVGLIGVFSRRTMQEDYLLFGRGSNGDILPLRY